MNGSGGSHKETVAGDRNRGEGRLEVPGSTFPHCLEPSPSNLNLVPLRYGCLFNRHPYRYRLSHGFNSLITRGDTMKTTLEIDQQLLRQAQKTLGTDTIKGTVDASLRTVIQRSQLQKLADALGTISLDLTPGQLRSQRHKRPSHVSR